MQAIVWHSIDLMLLKFVSTLTTADQTGARAVEQEEIVLQVIDCEWGILWDRFFKKCGQIYIDGL